ncbi:MAG: PAS domain S-box protein [Smithella sp.]
MMINQGHKMNDQAMKKQELIAEISALKQRNKELEQLESERRQVEEKLKKSEETFRTLAESSSFAIMMHQDDRWIYANRAAVEHSGYTEEELYSMHFWDFVHPDHREIVKQSGYLHQKGELPPGSYEFKIITKSGTVKWVSLSGNRIKYEDKPTALITVTDITVRKKAEAALRESEVKYRRIFESFEDLYYQSDEQDIIRVVSPSAYRLTGWHPDELIGKPVANIYTSPQGREELLAELSRSGSLRDYEVLMKRKDGTELYASLTASILIGRDGKPHGTSGTLRDMTGRKQAEEALRESEERYRSLVETASDIVFRTDSTGNITFVNSAGLLNGGYREEEIIGKHYASMVHPDMRDDAVRFFGRQFVKRIPNAYSEYPILTKDGREIWLGQNTHLVVKDGHVQGFQVVARDITERRRVEEALQESEKRYRALVENASDIVYRTDATGHFNFANSAALRITGYEEKEFIGKHFSSFIRPDMRDESVKFLVSQMRNRVENTYYEFLILTKDGREMWLGQNTQLVVDYGQVKGWQAVARDITERKQAEVALQESEKKYRNIYEHAIFGIYQATPEGRFLSANAAFAGMAGYDSPAELMDTVKNIGTQLYVSIEERKRFIESINANGIVKGFEVEFYKKDGSRFWALMNSRLVKDEKGRILYYEGIASDITQIKQAEVEKNILEERLQRAEKMEALGTLAGGVAHDLNNVLGVIVGYTELLLNEVDKSSPIRSRLTKIMNGSEKAAAIVQDLLTLARRGVPGRKVLDLNKIITDCQQSPEFANLCLHHPSVKIHTDFEPDLLKISGSSVHLDKTLYNLISNACESMTKGGGVTIRTTNQYLDKPLSGYDQIREGDYVVVSVADTGEGIPAADLQRIFEPFYTKKLMGRSGTGLGLAVVWGTVKDHQGYINVQSEEGKGSTFTLYFPVTRENISVEADSVAVSEYMGKNETILVVDDVQDQRNLAAEMLRNLNYQVSIVDSGEAAIAYIKGHQVDLLVLDMIMDPGMDGLDTYRRVLEIQPQQKAIIVSGFSESDRVHAAHALGAGGYVKKPYVMEKLGLAVRKELDRHDPR